MKIPKQENKELDESSKIVWDSEKIENVKKEIQKGYKPKNSPFFKNQVYWKRGDIAYKYTDHELSEIRKCATDIVHFAENYCFLMTDKGYANIKLRDYQIQMLRDFQANRFNVVLASRQIGKCATYNTVIRVRKDGVEYDCYMGELFYEFARKYRNLTIFEYCKMVLYKLMRYIG